MVVVEAGAAALDCAAGAGQPVVVEVVDAALLVGRWVWSVHFLHGRGAVRAMLWTALLAP